MAQGFNTELRCQQEWGWLLAIWLFLSGSGSGLFLLFEIFDLRLEFALLSLGTILLGAVVLLLELGSPLRAWRGFLRPGTSWLSRGVFSVCLFILSGFLSIAPAFETFSWLPWDGAGPGGRILGWFAGLCALMITLYPGFFLFKNRSIPFWNTPLLPVIFFGFSIMGASGIVLIASSFLEQGLQQIMFLAAGLIGANFLLVCVHLFAMARCGGSAGESVRLLIQGPLRWTFWIGAILVGMLLPLLGIAWLQSAVIPAGACLLIGGLLFRYCVLKAGVYVSPEPVPEGMDLSGLNRTNADLEREYALSAAHGARGRG